MSLERFSEIITAHTGLVIPEQEYSNIGKILVERIKQNRCRNAEEYFLLLEVPSAECDREWQSLVLLLTTGESYFFRDTGQFSLLEKVILPDIIDKRSKDNRELRIWSAGCSTGEEPYSLAILLQKLLPSPERWEILLMGSDINEQSLEMARQGRYGSWSFRRSEIASDETFFHRKKGADLFHGKDWVLDKSIRKMVTFRKVNLIKDPFPENHGELRDMDLILCRNVFIYFDSETVQRVVERFTQTLRMGGYLITGHAELSGTSPGGLTSRMYPESVVYQRQAVLDKGGRNPRVITVTPSATSREKKPLVGSETKSLPRQSPVLALPRPIVNLVDCKEKLKNADELFKRGAYGQAIAKAREVIDSDASFIPVQLRFQGLFLVARCHANLGEYPQAASYCHRAIQTNAFSGQPHFLLAHVLMEQSNDGEAKKHLQKALYLDSKHAPTYLELAAVLQKEGDNNRAKRLRESALELLRALPAHSRIETFEEWTVEELIKHVLELLRRDGH